MSLPKPFRVIVQCIVRCRVVDYWVYDYRWYWQANLRSFYEHHFLGYDCQTTRLRECTMQLLLDEARGLDAAENPEYLRGMCELITRCFPDDSLPTDDRAEQIRAMILEVPEELKSTKGFTNECTT